MSRDYVSESGESKTSDEVQDHQAVLIGTEAWKFSLGKKTSMIHPHGHSTTDNATAMAETVARGVGIAALPDIIVESYPT